MGQIANRQSLCIQRTAVSLASHSAIPRATNVARTNANRAIRIAAQRTQGLRTTNFYVFEGELATNEC